MVKGRDVEDQTKKRVLCLLAHYDELQVWVENRKSEIAMLQEEIQIEPAPKTTQWRESPGGGGFEKPSPEEAALERKEPVIIHQLVCRGTRDDDLVDALDWKDKAQDYVLESLKARIKKWKQQE